MKNLNLNPMRLLVALICSAPFFILASKIESRGLSALLLAIGIMVFGILEFIALRKDKDNKGE